MNIEDTDVMKADKRRKEVFGLRPARGWGADLFSLLVTGDLLTPVQDVLHFTC